jgi:hypothetical protein
MSTGPTFSPDFPANCPPSDAVPTQGAVFRITDNDPPTDEDFLTKYELKEEPPPRQTKFQLCCRHSLSVYRDLSEARHYRQAVPGDRRYIAAGTLTPDCGVTKDRPASGYHSHAEWWCYDGIERRGRFVIIE